MSCDVCIGGQWDGDSPSFYKVEERKARQDSRCLECSGTIQRGALYEYHSGKVDGEWYHGKTCLLCAEIRDRFTCGGSYEHGRLWEDMEELAFPCLTTASECFVALSAAAKAKVLAAWRKWKGLAA